MIRKTRGKRSADWNHSTLISAACIALSFGLSFFLPITIPTALARSPLSGSAVVNDAIPFSAFAYHPSQHSVLQADQWAAAYKLRAAEALYRKILKANPKSPGALNGLGKISYFKTTSSNQNLRDQLEILQSDAIQGFLSALRYQPGYVEAHVNLASVYMEQGRMGDAAEHLERALSLWPNYDYALAKKGEWLVRETRYNDALPYLQKAIQRNSANVAAHYYMAVAQTNRNELDDALDNLHTTLWLEPTHALAHYQMALIYEQQGNGAAAVEHYLKALSFKPELDNARLRLVDYYEKRGDTASALEQLKNVMASTADPDWALTEHVARLSIRNQQPELAVKTYRAWLNEHPEDRRANTALSIAKTLVAKQKLRDDDLISQGEAKRYAEQAIKYQPNNFNARMINAKLDKQIGPPSPLAGKDPHMVDVSLDKAVYQPYQSYEKGEILLARYQFNEAEQAFRIARRTGEGNRSQMLFGELFLTKGLPDLAEESFHLVLKQLPGNASARLGLAKAQDAKQEASILLVEARQNTRKNALPVAILQLEKSLIANIRNAQAHYLLGQLYEKSEEYAPAADHYFAYTQLEPNAGNVNGVKRKIEHLKVKVVHQKTQGYR